MNSRNLLRAPLAALVALFSLSLSATSWAAPEAKPGEVIVKFKATATASERQAIESDLGMTQVRKMDAIKAERGHVSRLTVDEAIARYKKHPKVEYIEPNYILHASLVPNDPSFPQLWGLQNTGQTGGTPGADIRAVTAWSQFKGSRDIIVAIIDTGMDYNHPDLAANVWVNTGEIPNNNIDDDNNGFVDDIHGWDFANNDHDPIDDHGHGTHCSGTIGAVGNNGIGVVGVNWLVTLMPIKFLDASGSGATDAAVSSINYAVQMGARVISASWGGGGASQALEDAITAAGQAGVLFVAAAGNSGQNTDVFPNYPSSYTLDNIIAVAATDHNDQLASFSNFGVVSVDLAAPGVDIYSTLPGGYGMFSGTSMATPHVAGAVALILGRFPSITAPAAKNLLLNRVDPLPVLAGRVLTGGRLNAFLPIAQPDSLAPGKITTLGTQGINGTWVALSWNATGDDGATGTASSYQLRYSTSPLTEANFDSTGTAVPGMPAPLPAGSPQSKTVTGLTFSTPYFFAIKAYDEFGNASPISNIATATTLAPPDIAVSPASLSASLLSGQQTTRVLTLSNTGPSDLNFKIDVASNDSGPQPAAAKIVGTFLIKDKTGDERETPPVTSAPSTTPFTLGHAAARAALSPGGIRITNTFATGLKLLLLHSGSDVSEMHSLLASFPDIALVDEFDARFTPVSLATLTPYDAVIVANNYAFGDPVALGNALADYSDQGGGVIVSVPSFITGFEIRGRFLDQGYIPFNLGTGPTAGSTLGAFDASHPIMSGVTTASGELLGSVSLSPGAELVASWINGQPLVATKEKVVAVNVFFGATGYWTGDVPLMLHNAAFWSGNAATWVTPAPREGVVPAGSQLGVVVTFDAAGQFGGDYYASLLVNSDDPDESTVAVPVHLHVTGAPDIAIEGQQVSISSTKTYNLSGAATTHDLLVPVPPPADGNLELVAEGDYGDFGETATVTAEGIALGSAGQVGTDCQAAKATFPLSAALLSNLTADGVVHVQVQNSPIVDVFCPLNQHTIRLRYALPSDHIDFGSLFVGGSRQRSVVIRNAGTDMLHVTSIATNNPVFTSDHQSLDMPPNTADTVTLTFQPAAAQPYTGTLTITSDDPDEGVLTVALSGEGLLPPDIDVSPTSLHADLLTGGQQSNQVTIRNTGLSDLTFDVEVTGPLAVVIQPGPRGPLPTGFDPAVVAAAAAPKTDEPGPLVSAAAPAGYRIPLTPQSRMAGAKVLIVQDAAPWGTAANEQILNGMGVPFDMISSSALAGMNLTGYRLIIIPSDQNTNYYATVGAQLAKLTSFVTAGGTLEVHAAGWGWQSGNASAMTIPGGMLINQYSSSSNQVLAPAHPLVAGVPNPFFGGSASHAYFTQIPAGATAVAADDQSRTNLVVYSLGGGTVVAGCQTFEFGYANGQSAGLILQNMIPFSFRPGPGWLSADPTSGRLAPGASAILTVTFNATGLNGGDYAGIVNVRSNDPDESEVPIAASMHVTGAPDLVVVGGRDSVVSDQNYNTPSAVTTHHLAVVSPSAGDATLELDIDGDFGDPTETATVTVEGIRLGEVGRLGIDCTPGHGSFTILAADFANLAADGFVDVEVRNSFDVDLFCAIQHHRVTLHYPKPTNPIDFGSLFVGRCANQNLEVQNAGTDLLTISSLSVTGAGFSVTPSSMSLQPGEHRTVSLQFCPPTAQLLHGTLTINSDDPDESVVTFALQGTGLVPPDIQVTPTAFHEQLLTGQTRSRTLTVENQGGSDLNLQLDLQAQGVAVAVAVETRPLARQRGPVSVDPHVADASVASAGAALDEPGVRSDRQPAGYRVAAGRQQTMAGATVLILQDTAPWGSTANETILNTRGIAFDMRPSGQLAGLDLSPYRLIIIPSDQPTGYYLTVSGQLAKLEAFVNGGGVLEVHAAGWGFSGGNASLMQIPGGLQILQFFSATNTVIDPSHPIAAGVPSPFSGNWASHAQFANIPATAQRIIADESATPNTVVYPFGFGLVVAAGQTLEFGYVNNQGAGIVLQNMLAFSYRPGPKWLDVNPRSAVVPAGSVATFTVTFDATDLFGGDYAGNLIVDSNDPDESQVVVPVSLHVTGVPDLQVAGKQLSVSSTKTYATSGSSTSHTLALQPVGPGSAELQLDIDGDYGDFVETATVFVDGILLGEVGRLGIDCTPGRGTFPISAAQFATIAADGVAQVLVQNTFDVDVFCAVNQHTVTLRYQEVIDPLDLGSPFVGACSTRVVQVLNKGTDALVVTDVHGSRSEFTASPTSFTLARGDTQEVVVHFCPVAPGDVTGTLSIVSNDPDGDATVNLHGVGLVPPDIALARTSVTEDLLVGQTSTQAFAIANESGSDLTVKLSLVIPNAMPALTAASDAVRTSVPAAPIDLSAVQRSYRAYAESSPSQPAVDVASTPAVATAASGGRKPTGSAVAALQAAGGPAANAVPVFYDDFETGGPGWTHRSASPDSLDLWAISGNRSNSGSQSYHVSQHLGVGSEVLESPVISLQGHDDAFLVFAHWYNFDDCSGSPDFDPDGGIVEVRDVATGIWEQVYPVGGYPHTLDVVCSNPLELRQAYAHDSQQPFAFDTAQFDLTAYAGKSIQIRFHAGWDCGNCEQNEGWYVDDVLVYSNTTPWVSVSPTQGTIPAGSVKNFDLKFDATRIGPGVYDANLVVASNDPDESSLTVPIRLYVANLMANVDVHPNTLNLGSNGNFITAHIELPAGHDVNGIDIAGVTLNGVPTAPHPASVGDQDGDGTPDLMVKFPRDQVSGTLSEGDDVRIVVSGALAGGDRFMAIDRIRVTKHNVTTPVAGEVVASGASHAIAWSVPPGWHPDYAEISYTLDNGVTWTQIAGNVQGRSYSWSVPNITAPQVRVRVGLFDASGLIAYDSNDGVFQIRSSVTDAGGPPVSSRVQLLPSVPNPFVSGRSTVIAYELSEPAVVSLAVYSVTGQLTRELVQGSMPAGRHQVTWDGSDRSGRRVSAGVYFVQMKTGAFKASKTITMLN